MTRWLALALLAAAPAAPQAAARARVAVMDVRNVQGVAEGTATILTDIVVSDVATAGHDVVSRGDIAAMIGFERQKQVLGCGDETSCLAEIGGALGVDYMLTGQVGQIGSQYRISLLLVDAKKVRVAARAAEFCEKNEDALVRAARGTVTQLLLTIQAAQPKPAAPRQAAAPPKPAPAQAVPIPPPPLAPKPPSPAAATAPPAAAPPSSTSPPPGPEPRAGPDHTLAFIAYSASGALAVTGVLFGLVAQVRYDNLKKLQGQPGYALAWETRKADIKKAAGAADLAYLGAAVAAGTGTWLWYRENRIAIGPTAVPGGVGLAAAATF
jgi:TolB-like protein